MAVAFLVTVVVGFGPTYSFKPVHPSPPLNPLMHLHGLESETFHGLATDRGGQGTKALVRCW
jgi:hypothetical protein